MTATAYQRLTLVARLVRRDVLAPLPVRRSRDDDRVELPQLMFDAYRGGLDDPGMTLEDARGYVRTFFDGAAATPLFDCSFVALDSDRIVAAALVCMDEGRPLLARAYTVPAWQNRGVARALIQLSMNALLDRGETVLGLFVKVGNLQAEHLYESMGFAFERGD